ncbi:hypothetical protein ACFW88_22015, partial [Streptomyces anandii]
MSDLAGHARRLPLVLRNPSFGKVWAGQVLSQAASRMYQVGAVWWLVGVAGGDHRGLDSGLFLMVSSLPAIVLAPVVGGGRGAPPPPPPRARPAAGAGGGRAARGRGGGRA